MLNPTWNKVSFTFTTHSTSQAAFTRLAHTGAQRYFGLIQEELLQLTFPPPRMTVCTSKTLPAQRTTALLSRNPVFTVALTALRYGRHFRSPRGNGNLMETFDFMATYHNAYLCVGTGIHQPVLYILWPYSHATDWYKIREAQRGAQKCLVFNHTHVLRAAIGPLSLGGSCR